MIEFTFEPVDQVINKSAGAEMATVTNLSGADLMTLIRTRGDGVPPEQVKFPDDPLTYLWSTTQIVDEGRGGAESIALEGEIQEAPELTPLDVKQRRFAGWVNSLPVDKFRVYFGPVLPALLDIPTGEEGGEYQYDEATDTWEWNPAP